MLSNPTVRVFVRALIAGLLTALGSIQAADNYGGESWVTAAVAGGVAFLAMAAAELGTPINPTVGWGKSASS